MSRSRAPSPAASPSLMHDQEYILHQMQKTCRELWPGVQGPQFWLKIQVGNFAAYTDQEINYIYHLMQEKEAGIYFVRFLQRVTPSKIYKEEVNRNWKAVVQQMSDRYETMFLTILRKKVMGKGAGTTPDLTEDRKALLRTVHDATFTEHAQNWHMHFAQRHPSVLKAVRALSNDKRVEDVLQNFMLARLPQPQARATSSLAPLDSATPGPSTSTSRLGQGPAGHRSGSDYSRGGPEAGNTSINPIGGWKYGEDGGIEVFAGEGEHVSIEEQDLSGSPSKKRRVGAEQPGLNPFMTSASKASTSTEASSGARRLFSAALGSVGLHHKSSRDDVGLETEFLIGDTKHGTGSRSPSPVSKSRRGPTSTKPSAGDKAMQNFILSSLTHRQGQLQRLERQVDEQDGQIKQQAGTIKELRFRLAALESEYESVTSSHCGHPDEKKSLEEDGHQAGPTEPAPSAPMAPAPMTDTTTNIGSVASSLHYSNPYLQDVRSSMGASFTSDHPTGLDTAFGGSAMRWGLGAGQPGATGGDEYLNNAGLVGDVKHRTDPSYPPSEYPSAVTTYNPYPGGFYNNHNFYIDSGSLPPQGLQNMPRAAVTEAAAPMTPSASVEGHNAQNTSASLNFIDPSMLLPAPQRGSLGEAQLSNPHMHRGSHSTPAEYVMGKYGFGDGFGSGM